MVFYLVGNDSDFQDSQMRSFNVGGVEVMVVKIAGNYYAMGNVCTHRGCPLSDGFLEGYVVTCECHGFQFDVGTGEVVGIPLIDKEPSYEVKMEDGKIFVRV